jgi:hypothetical protein
MSQRAPSRRNRLVLILGGIGAVCGACVFLSLVAAVVSPPRAATPTPRAASTATLAALPTATNGVVPPTATVAPAPPTDTAEPPPPPTDTALPPTEPPPPPTDTAVPPTAAPAVQYTASASVDKPTPPQGATVRVTGKLLRDGTPVAGVWMRTRWIYKYSENSCEAKTKADGTAACSRDIGARVTVGYEVTIQVRFEDEGGTLLATASTSFTPKDTAAAAVAPTKAAPPPPAASAPTKAAPAKQPAKAPAASLRYDPGGPDRDCPDFRTHAEAQAFFLAAGGPGRDPHRLDADHDGVACETLP